MVSKKFHGQRAYYRPAESQNFKSAENSGSITYIGHI
jgi:hypothetical protein